VDRESIAQRLRALYAEALEYPPEVFEDSAVLEADLGVDSVKQTELLARVSEQFGLGPRPEALRMSDYATFGSVIDFVGSSTPARAV
jgi:acyl carrier protein